MSKEGKSVWCKIFGHKWQAKGHNRYGTVTYRECKRCPQAQEIVPICDNPDWFEEDKYRDCPPKDWDNFPLYSSIKGEPV